MRPCLHVAMICGRSSSTRRSIQLAASGTWAVKFDPVIFRPKYLLRFNSLVILSTRYFSTAQYSPEHATGSKQFLKWWTMKAEVIRLSVLLSSMHLRYACASMCRVYLQVILPPLPLPTVSPLRWRCYYIRPRNTFLIRRFYSFGWLAKNWLKITNNQTYIKINYLFHF